MATGLSIASAKNLKNLSDTEEHEQFIRSLAMEIAKDMDELEDILKRFGLDRAQFDEITSTRFYKAAWAQAVKDWNSAGNAKERTRLKSQILLENAMPELYADMLNKDYSLAARADLFAKFSKIAGYDANTVPNPNGGEMFNITINLGAEKPIVIHQRQDLLPEVTDVEDI